MPLADKWIRRFSAYGHWRPEQQPGRARSWRTEKPAAVAPGGEYGPLSGHDVEWTLQFLVGKPVRQFTRFPFSLSGGRHAFLIWPGRNPWRPPALTGAGAYAPNRADRGGRLQWNMPGRCSRSNL